LDEVRAFLRRFREQDAVVGDDADRHAVNMGEARNEGGAEARLEFVELRSVDDACNDFAYVVGLARIVRNDAVEFLRVVQWLGVGLALKLYRLVMIQPADG